MEVKNFKELAYLISYPAEFSKEKEYPLIIFLHGAGSRSKPTEALQNGSCLRNLQSFQNEKRYILLAPHCKCGDWNQWMSLLIGLVEETKALAFVDEARVYLTGNSMGGYGTWELSLLHADWFASVMPLCGGGIPGFAKKLVDLPIRAFHGLRDQRVDPIESLQMAKAVNNAGGYAELILFPELAHNCWDAVYSDEKNYDWLLSFTNKRSKTPVEELSGDQYG